MFGQITDLEIVREIERRGLYTSALVAPPIEPIVDIVVREPDIIYPSEEPIEFPEEPVIVYPRGPEEEEEVPYMPIVTPPWVTVPAIEIPEKKPFLLTKTHIIAGAVVLAILVFFGGAPAAARAAAARLPAADRARTRTITEVY